MTNSLNVRNTTVLWQMGGKAEESICLSGFRGEKKRRRGKIRLFEKS